MLIIVFIIKRVGVGSRLACVLNMNGKEKKGRELCMKMTHYPLQLCKALLFVEAMGAGQMKSLGLAII